MRFKSEELQLFKKPAGILIKNEDFGLESLSPYLKADLIISVGDATTEKLLSLGIVPSIQVVDAREQRQRRCLPPNRYVTEIKCANPAGGISNGAVNALMRAFDSAKPTRITVDGEEDLIGVVVIAFAPDDSVMFYGQPNEGMVAVRTNEQARKKFAEVINRMRKTFKPTS